MVQRLGQHGSDAAPGDVLASASAYARTSGLAGQSSVRQGSPKHVCSAKRGSPSSVQSTCRNTVQACTPRPRVTAAATSSASGSESSRQPARARLDREPAPARRIGPEEDLAAGLEAQPPRARVGKEVARGVVGGRHRHAAQPARGPGCCRAPSRDPRRRGRPRSRRPRCSRLAAPVARWRGRRPTPPRPARRRRRTRPRSAPARCRRARRARPGCRPRPARRGRRRPRSRRAAARPRSARNAPERPVTSGWSDGTSLGGNDTPETPHSISGGCSRSQGSAAATRAT